MRENAKIYKLQLYNEKALHNYFMPCHGMCIALHNQCGARKGSLGGIPTNIHNSFPAFQLAVFPMAWYK